MAINFISNKLLSDQFVDHLAPKLRKLFVAARMVVGQLVVIKSEQMQKGHVNIANVMHALDRFGTDFICRANRVPGFGSSTREPHGHRLGIVIATIGLPPAPQSVVGSILRCLRSLSKAAIGRSTERISEPCAF